MITDKKRLDFLEKMNVVADIGFGFGAELGFNASPSVNADGELVASDIRFKIDQLIIASKKK